MTRAFLTLKDYPELNAKIGDQLIQDLKSSEELKMDELIDLGFFKELTEYEALEHYNLGKRVKL